jgi:hypothetical protein
MIDPGTIGFMIGWLGGFLTCGFYSAGYIKSTIAVFIIFPPLSVLCEHLAR